MSWLDFLPIGAELLGSFMDSDNIGDAESQLLSANDRALMEQRRQYDLGREDLAPYRTEGRNALADISALRNFDPTPTAASVQEEPGYQFGLKEGLQGVQGSAAARGGLYSGNALKRLTEYGNDYATTKYNDAWNRAQTGFGNRWGRLAGLAGVGQSATGQSVAQGQNFANQYGSLQQQGGNVQAQAGIARGNVLNNAMGSLVQTGRNNEWWK